MNMIINNKVLGPVADWVITAKGRGLYTGATPRILITALKRIVPVVESLNISSVQDMLNRLDSVFTEFEQEIGDVNKATMSVYKSRVKRALHDYLNNTSTAEKTPSENFKLQPSEPSEPRRSFSDPNRFIKPRSQYMTISSGEIFAYQIPTSGYNVQDAVRIFAHILSHASDFDPFNPDKNPLLLMSREVLCRQGKEIE
jgi:hypothetical protein